MQPVVGWVVGLCVDDVCCVCMQALHDQCDVTLVELPRLNLSFETKKGPDGKIRMYSRDYSGLFVSSNQSSPHTAGLPHVLALEDVHGQLFLVVPSYGLVRPQIRTCPLSTALVPSPRDAEWAAVVQTRYFVYPVHSSGTFLMTQTLVASFYLVRAVKPSIWCVRLKLVLIFFILCVCVCVCVSICR